MKKLYSLFWCVNLKIMLEYAIKMGEWVPKVANKISIEAKGQIQ